ncbi:hypothetical protein SNEBB_000982 [Seison nebaliae]|nr:hypothetical protein SNEBB_000982 [Seison nebaliae]
MRIRASERRSMEKKQRARLLHITFIICLVFVSIITFGYCIFMYIHSPSTRMWHLFRFQLQTGIYALLLPIMCTFSLLNIAILPWIFCAITRSNRISFIVIIVVTFMITTTLLIFTCFSYEFCRYQQTENTVTTVVPQLVKEYDDSLNEKSNIRSVCPIMTSLTYFSYRCSADGEHECCKNRASDLKTCSRTTNIDLQKFISCPIDEITIINETRKEYRKSCHFSIITFSIVAIIMIISLLAIMITSAMCVNDILMTHNHNSSNIDHFNEVDSAASDYVQQVPEIRLEPLPTEEEQPSELPI